MSHLPPPPAGTVQAVITGVNQGVEWANVFWFTSSVSATPTRTQMDTLATSLLGTYQADFKSMMNAGITIEQCDVLYQLTADSVVPGISLNPVVGTRAGTALPAMCCGVINWHSNYDHYRGGHGRTYLTGPSATDLTNPSIFTSSYKSSLSSAAGSWLSAVNAYAGAPFTALTLCLLRRISDKQPLDPPVLRPIVGQSVRSVIGTQRRRLT